MSIDAIKAINDYRNGSCKFLWDEQAVAGPIPTDGKLCTEEKILRLYDNVNSAGNMMVDRWMRLQYALFLSVVVSSLLLFPVLLFKLEYLKDKTIWASGFVVILLLEQTLASICVVLVAINIFLNNRKLRRIEGLNDDLKKVAAGRPKADPVPTG